MKRLVIPLLGTFALALAATAFAAPGLKLDKHQLAKANCGGDGPPLVNVHYDLVNDADSGFAGNAWAMDSIDRHLRIWQVGSGTYCAIVEDHGRFTTFAGASPSGSGTVSAGLKGELQGGYRSTEFTGTYAPTLATRGDLGTFDLMCDTSFNCPGDHPSPLSYFSTTSGFDLAWWGWIYRAGHHGTWLNQLDVAPADSGDITG